MQDFVFRKSFLTHSQQQAIADAARQIEPGFYVPVTRFGQKMRLQMNCLGQHWSARDYKYRPTRTDVDNLPCASIPPLFHGVATHALLETGYLRKGDLRPFTACIVNWYDEDTGRLGDHVDGSESKEALASGYPVVSLSIGTSCVFRFGGLAKSDAVEKFTLESGDLVIFGRSLRLAYHGVSKIIPGTSPAGLDLKGRLNLTFRIV